MLQTRDNHVLSNKEDNCVGTIAGEVTLSTEMSWEITLHPAAGEVALSIGDNCVSIAAGEATLSFEMSWEIAVSISNSREITHYCIKGGNCT